jgi:hypothetical protein
MKNAFRTLLVLLFSVSIVSAQTAGGGFPSRPTVSEIRIRPVDPVNTQSRIIRGDTVFTGNCRSDPVNFYTYNLPDGGGGMVNYGTATRKQWRMGYGLEENYENPIYPPSGVLTADAGTTDTVLADAGLSGLLTITNQVQAYCLYNVTRGQSRMILSSTTGVTPTVTLESAITGQASGDQYRILLRETETYADSCLWKAAPIASEIDCIRFFQFNVDKGTSERINAPVLSSATMRIPRGGDGLVLRPDSVATSETRCYRFIPNFLVFRACNDGTTDPATASLSEVGLQMQTINGAPGTQAGSYLEMWGRSFGTGVATRNFVVTTTTGAGYTNFGTWDGSGANYSEVMQFITTGAGAAGRTVNVFANAFNQNGNPVVSQTSGSFSLTGSTFSGSASGSITYSWTKNNRQVCLAYTSGTITFTTGTTPLTTTLATLPSNIRPAADVMQLGYLADGSNFRIVVLNIGTSGIVDVRPVNTFEVIPANARAGALLASTTYTMTSPTLNGCYLSAT